MREQHRVVARVLRASCLLVACPLLDLTGLTGCTTSAPTLPTQVFDESSGATLIVVKRPMVLARSRTDVAANARDYVTLVVAQEDRGGKYLTWLVVHRWSTVDARISPDSGVGSGRMSLVADGREIILTPANPAPPALRRRDLLLSPPTGVSLSEAFAVDLGTLRYVAVAGSVSLRFLDDPLQVAYTQWDDGRPELREFLEAAIAP